MVRNAAQAALFALTLGFSVAPACAHDNGHDMPPWQGASAWPDRVIATFEADPATSLAVSWQRSRPTLPGVAYHSVRFDDLKPDTLYAYRVMGADGHWSEWFQTRTAPTSGPVRFIYMGDAQNGVLSLWSRTIRAAFQAAPDARFMLHAGDLVNRGSRDVEWADWFKAGSFLHAMVPAIPVAGNHEYDMAIRARVTRRSSLATCGARSSACRWRANLPESSARNGLCCALFSADLDVFVLDTNQSEMHRRPQWLDAQPEGIHGALAHCDDAPSGVQFRWRARQQGQPRTAVADPAAQQRRSGAAGP
jgi:hypothetical protein